MSKDYLWLPNSLVYILKICWQSSSNVVSPFQFIMIHATMVSTTLKVMPIDLEDDDHKEVTSTFHVDRLGLKSQQFSGDGPRNLHWLKLSSTYLPHLEVYVILLGCEFQCNTMEIFFQLMSISLWQSTTANNKPN